LEEQKLTKKNSKGKTKSLSKVVALPQRIFNII